MWNTLGQWALASKDLARAEEAFRRALEADPSLESAIRGLERVKMLGDTGTPPP